MTEKSKEIYDDLKGKGFSDSEITDAMTDGEYLKVADIDQETAEEIYNYLESK